MATFPEAEARLLKNVYVCKKTGKKMKLPINKILSGKFSTRKGMSKHMRTKRKIAKKGK